MKSYSTVTQLLCYINNIIGYVPEQSIVDPQLVCVCVCVE